MIKLIVHAGTHKTATTSFQKICFENRLDLASKGVLYPLLNFYPNDSTLRETLENKNVKPELIPQHSYIPRFLSKGNLGDVSRFLENALTTAKKKSCKTVLLSGEDFESSLVDTSIACKLKNLANRTGFSEISLAVTKRPSKDYFLSLYNQLASQKIPCNPISLYETINSHGYASFSSKHGIFHYVFDLHEMTKKLEQDAQIACKVMDYSNFLEVHPGYHFLQSISPNKKEKIKNLQINTHKSNTSQEKGNIEFLYACAFLSLAPNSETYRHNKQLLQALIKRRKDTLLHAIKLVEQNLKRFD
jgi:hypothetical protein